MRLKTTGHESNNYNASIHNVNALTPMALRLFQEAQKRFSSYFFLQEITSNQYQRLVDLGYTTSHAHLLFEKAARLSANMTRNSVIPYINNIIQLDMSPELFEIFPSDSYPYHYDVALEGWLFESLKHVRPNDVLKIRENGVGWSWHYATILAAHPERQARIEEGIKKGLITPDSRPNLYDMRWLLVESDYDFDFLFDMRKLKGMTDLGIIRALNSGHTEYEIKTYGNIAVQNYSPTKLSQITVKRNHFKSLSNVFNAREYIGSYPTVQDIENLVKAGFTSASEYKKMSKLLFVGKTYDPKYVPLMMEARTHATLKDAWDLFDAHGGVNVLKVHELKALKKMLAAGNTVESYRKALQIRNAQAEEDYLMKSSQISVISELLVSGKNIDDIKALAQSGKALGDML